MTTTAIVHLALLVKITLQGEWRRKEGNILGLTDIEHLGSNSYFKNAKETRNSFKEYFNQEGQIE